LYRVLNDCLNNVVSFNAQKLIRVDKFTDKQNYL